MRNLFHFNFTPTFMIIKSFERCSAVLDVACIYYFFLTYIQPYLIHYIRHALCHSSASFIYVSATFLTSPPLPANSNRQTSRFVIASIYVTLYHLYE